LCKSLTSKWELKRATDEPGSRSIEKSRARTQCADGEPFREVLIETPQAAETKQAEIASPPQKISPSASKFTDFVKRCQPANWKMEHSASVFSSRVEHQWDAEKFRTLRSRLYQNFYGTTAQKDIDYEQHASRRKDLCCSKFGREFYPSE
jgi:hypothetical protein